MAPVYQTYDAFANDDERAFLEYFMRDVYEQYGYDFHYYKGELIDEAWVKERIHNFSCLNGYIYDTWKTRLLSEENKDWSQEDIDVAIRKILDNYEANRLHIIRLLMRSLNFVNKRGQPLRLMPQLKLDPALLEQPLYH